MAEVDARVAEVASVGLATQYVRIQGISWGNNIVPLEDRRGVDLNNKLKKMVLDLLK